MSGSAPPARAHWLLPTTILASSLSFIDGTVVNVGLSALGSSLDAEEAALQWVVSGYLLPLSALLLLSGALGDRYGRRRVLAAGLVLFTAASLLCAAAGNLGWVLAGRVAQGVGAALLAVASPWIGKRAARTGSHALLAGGALGVAAGLALLLRVQLPLGYATQVLPGLVVMAVGLAYAVAPLTTAVLAAVDDAHTGAASGLNSAVARSGGLIGTARVGGVLAVGAGPALVRLSTARWPAARWPAPQLQPALGCCYRNNSWLGSLQAARGRFHRLSALQRRGVFARMRHAAPPANIRPCRFPCSQRCSSRSCCWSARRTSCLARCRCSCCGTTHRWMRASSVRSSRCTGASPRPRRWPRRSATPGQAGPASRLAPRRWRLTWWMRRQVVPAMDALQADIQANAPRAIARFRRVHGMAIAVNTAQLAVVVGSLVAVSVQTRSGL